MNQKIIDPKINKQVAIFIALLFLYLFCTLDSISLAEKGTILKSMEQEKEAYGNIDELHKNPNEPSKKLKKPKNIEKIRKKNKILEKEFYEIIDIF